MIIAADNFEITVSLEEWDQVSTSHLAFRRARPDMDGYEQFYGVHHARPGDTVRGGTACAFVVGEVERVEIGESTATVTCRALPRQFLAEHAEWRERAGVPLGSPAGNLQWHDDGWRHVGPEHGPPVIGEGALASLRAHAEESTDVCIDLPLDGTLYVGRSGQALSLDDYDALRHPEPTKEI